MYGPGLTFPGGRQTRRQPGGYFVRICVGGESPCDWKLQAGRRRRVPRPARCREMRGDAQWSSGGVSDSGGWGIVAEGTEELGEDGRHTPARPRSRARKPSVPRMDVPSSSKAPTPKPATPSSHKMR